MRAGGRSITPTVALIAWAIAWIAGQMVATALVAAIGCGRPSEAPLPVVLASTMVVWVCLPSSMAYTSRRFGCGRFVSDYGLQIRGADVLGVGIGASLTVRDSDHAYDIVLRDDPSTGNLMLTAGIAERARDPDEAARADLRALGLNFQMELRSSCRGGRRERLLRALRRHSPW